MTTNLGPALSDVMGAVGPLYRRATRSLETGASATGASVGTRSVLELLTALGTSQPVPRIAATLGLSRQFVQRSVHEGVGAELLALADNPDHLRSRLVSATPEGRRWMQQVHRREQRLLGAAAERGELSAEEVDACLRVLRTLLTEVAWD